MNKIKIILSYIIGFILSVALFGLASLLIIKYSVSSEKFMYRLMDENNYYENVYNSIIEDIKDYMMSSGLETEVLDGVITKEHVKKDVQEYTKGLYSGKKYVVETEELKTTLKNNINSYLKKYNLGIENTNELDLFINDVADIYKKEVSFYNTLDIISSKLVQIQNILGKAILIDSAIVLVSILLLLIFRKINVGACVMSSGLIMFLCKLFIYERVDSQNITIVSDEYSLIIRSIFRYVSGYMISISIILICIGFIFSLFGKSEKIVEKKPLN